MKNTNSNSPWLPNACPFFELELEDMNTHLIEKHANDISPENLRKYIRELTEEAI